LFYISKDWVSDEFNIYVSKNTHEITAVYMKENTSLEITLKVPIDYPKKYYNHRIIDN
jgi:hypothetical protein